MQSAAQQAYPDEACGILLGEGGRITAFQSAPNVHPSPRTHFEIDPQTLINAHKQARTGGPQVIGYFHSHPKGEAIPSKTDRAMSAGDGAVWAIAAGGEVRFWYDGVDVFRAIAHSLSKP